MSISVKFFASLREELGISSAEVDRADAETVGALWEHLTDAPLPASLLCACNHEYVALDSKVNDGDEVAFFPPVNGG